jgi:hypothetical protein
MLPSGPRRGRTSTRGDAAFRGVGPRQYFAGPGRRMSQALDSPGDIVDVGLDLGRGKK